ncbi:MAG: beta family protein [Providencia sp.]
MNNYIPFLKLKGSEISALRNMHSTHPGIHPTPFFDFPRKKPKKSRREPAAAIKNKEELFSDDLIRLKRKFEINLKFLKKFYMDNFDVEDTIKHKGKYNYSGIIETFGPLGMVPVTGLDRHHEHIICIKDGLINGLISAERIALRLTQEDFESYAFCSSALIPLLKDLSSHFQDIDIIFDCRVCQENTAHILHPQILAFLGSLLNDGFSFSKIIVTGSTIPASISNIIQTRDEKHVVREEFIVYDNVFAKDSELDGQIFMGDYTCVSPDYSDVELFDEDMDNVTTAKLIYPYEKNLLLIRGGKFKTDRGELGKLAKKLIAKIAIYRGRIYSTGDGYLYDKANNIGKPATASTIVPHLVNLHMIYMFNK